MCLQTRVLTPRLSSIPITADNFYGLEKFWAFLKYRKDTRPLEIMPELKVSCQS